MNIAIITGASSGLGAWYARLLDAEGLDELWLIARREKRLQTIAGLVKTPARVLALDLADEDAAHVIEDELAAVQTPEVRWLVNCAGFGCIGRAGEIPLATLAQMVQVNCTAPLRLISAALPFMNAGSCILNVASCAAFQPVPGVGVYAATKSFLLSYSRSLGHDLAPQGIGVTTVCPYWIRDTEFISRAEATDTQGLFKNFPFPTDAETVARRSIRAAKNGISVCTPDAVSFFDRLAAKLLPKDLLMSLMGLWHRL
ncbi:MAG: SDR family NAD(P)-dependent oxidoreductase [Selenomonas sp.]|uniref:SDR family NAD(P)-dependent oxidoreductase n=1 Tax=Selenomonas sp. TaxID=2053611 RepID=UPI0025D585D0|nr:SDR family NAD(P)-dependent oxidoreductase [Selenomonas sp.]MCI6232242.1 SDR family NAD(P)-dependent oxidoreductase [Selenomonas sp.]